MKQNTWLTFSIQKLNQGMIRANGSYPTLFSLLGLISLVVAVSFAFSFLRWNPVIFVAVVAFAIGYLFKRSEEFDARVIFLLILFGVVYFAHTEAKNQLSEIPEVTKRYCAKLSMEEDVLNSSKYKGCVYQELIKDLEHKHKLWEIDLYY